MRENAADTHFVATYGMAKGEHKSSNKSSPFLLPDLSAHLVSSFLVVHLKVDYQDESFC